MTEDNEGNNGKQVIARAAAVLRALENQAGGLSLAQIAKSADLPRTTVHRIVAALEAQQLVASGKGGVKLGPAIVRLAASAHTDVVTVIRPYAEALGRRTRETVDVCVYRGLHAVSVDQYASDRELRVVSAIGTAYPIHCTAHGKALLADLPYETVAGLFDGQLEQRTPNTITDIGRLHAELDAIREIGYGVDTEEHALGVCGIGVTLNTGMTERYAISLGVPAQRFAEHKSALLSALMQCKAEVEAIIGA
ncbi:IclR family transcriptional regulator [Pseudoduganella violacea]|uniref:DNA-binding IclR family transcriptional regulator n=1 Tax=Pseudoduganella violacea TaxID=1715466 RepID=A0A7W5BFG5_9BURK|nr:IclR family transcriptional regulator [Pseudoduganella violacea]MBB3122143.1 DNA-binding IclR family transcriptional regulator [Pseudoduganella violacea]